MENPDSYGVILMVFSQPQSQQVKVARAEGMASSFLKVFSERAAFLLIVIFVEIEYILMDLWLDNCAY